MRRILSRLVTIIAAVTLPAVVAHAQDRAHPDIIVPQRHIVRPDVIGLESVLVDVKITDRVATTSMAVTLHNPTGSPREAQLVLPVPSGAAIRSFGLDAISAEPNAILLPSAEARKIYREIVSKMVDPGLLEFIGTDLIRSSVFPVPANEQATFRVVYEHALPAESGRFEYVLPRSESLDQSGVAWTINLDLHTTRPIGLLYSPTHALDEKRISSERMAVKVLDAGEPGPFRMYFVFAGEGGAGMTTLLYPDPRVGNGKGGYFMCFLDAPQSSEGSPMKREVTLVIDRSGSMRGEKIDQAKAAALQIIEALDDGERFNIVDYSDTIERFASESVVKTDDTVRQVRSYIATIKAVGGTNIHGALLEAVRPEPQAKTLPIILFLTDGLPTVGPTSETEIRESISKANTHERRIFTFGVGFDVNAPLLTALAMASRAAPAFVAPGEDVEVAVGRVFTKLSGPVLALPELRTVSAELTVGPSPIRELMPSALPDVFAGEQLIVLGQYTTDDQMTMQIVGDDRGKQRRFSTVAKPSEASATNSFVARLWAQRKIGTLIDAIRQAGADGQLQPDDPRYKELVDEVVALSQEYGILTEYTSFLAVEDLYRQNIDTDGEIQYKLGREAIRERSGERGVQAEVTNQARQTQRRVDASKDDALMVYSINSALQPSSGRGGGAPGGNSVPIFFGVTTGQSITKSVQSIAGRSFYLRGNRWLEADLLDKADDKPDRVIAFGTDAYDAFVEELVDAKLQAILGLNTDQDVDLIVNGQRVLLKRPTE